MDSFRWKCKYCNKRFRVAEIMRDKRVRCPACAEFSKARVRFKKKGSKLPGPHFSQVKEIPADADSVPTETQEPGD